MALEINMELVGLCHILRQIFPLLRVAAAVVRRNIKSLNDLHTQAVTNGDSIICIIVLFKVNLHDKQARQPNIGIVLL